MKKLAVAALVLLMAGAAHAEQKLLVTDILNPGQLEFEANLEYFSSRGNISVIGEPGKLKESATESRVYGGVGVCPGAEVSISVPYLFSEHERADVSSLGITEFANRDGLGDLSVGVKARVGEFQGVKVVAGLDVKFDTASEGNGGTGTTDIAPLLAASKEMGHHLVPYASYRPVFRSNGVADSHVLTVGLEKELNHSVTLDVKGDVSFNTSGNSTSPYQTYDIEVGSYLQVARNLYVIPSIALFSSTKHNEGDVEVKAVSGYRPGIALYYLF